ncbi:MAG: ATP-binding protein [Butyrivibrio sp.]|nr:ATP-binding protein [Butyrivibrio sp.]
MNTITVKAQVDNLEKVLSFIDSELENMDCSMKTQMQIDVAVEEIFVNIANYAYEGKEGDATISIEKDASENSARISFTDKGIPYNPLEKEDPDITLSAAERQIGGLGIFMVKKTMDRVDYEYKNNENRLTLVKKI